MSRENLHSRVKTFVMVSKRMTTGMVTILIMSQITLKQNLITMTYRQESDCCQLKSMSKKITRRLLWNEKKPFVNGSCKCNFSLKQQTGVPKSCPSFFLSILFWFLSPSSSLSFSSPSSSFLSLRPLLPFFFSLSHFSFASVI